MDQDVLVEEQIEAGADFLRRFESEFPVRAAFWLKEDENVQWYLFVASDDFEGGNTDGGYRSVSGIARELGNPNFDRFRVMLIGAGEPTAQAAMDIYRRYPARIPTHFGGKIFGGTSVEGVYIYPPTAPARA